jgi:SAM-dependent methyltransferase
MSSDTCNDRTLYVHPSWYDTLHTPGTAWEVDVLQDLARRHTPARSRGKRMWLEPGCGSGRYVRLLARRGQTCVGVDMSAEMVRYAAGRARSAREQYVQGDMRRMHELPLGARVDVCFCLHNTIRHLQRDADIAQHLRSVGRVLAPGGVYIVGTSLAEGPDLQPAETAWQGKRGTLHVREAMQFEGVRGARGRWVERASGVVLVSRGRTMIASIDVGYMLWTGGVARWKRILTRAGMREIDVTDAHGRSVSDTRASGTGYLLRVLRLK